MTGKGSSRAPGCVAVCEGKARDEFCNLYFGHYSSTCISFTVFRIVQHFTLIQLTVTI